MEFLRDSLFQYIVTTLIGVVGLILTAIGLRRSGESKSQALPSMSPGAFPPMSPGALPRKSAGGAIVLIVLGLIIIASSVICFVSASVVYGTVSNIIGGFTSNFPGGSINNPFVSTPDGTLDTFCHSIQSGSYQNAYDQYSSKLKAEVSSVQFTETWSDTHWDSCTHDSVVTSGNTATTRITTHEFFTKKITTYNVSLIQEGNNWKIDSIDASG
jgi:hypothetical protein